MNPEFQAILDCGTFARMQGFPLSDCPAYASAIHVALWQAGWLLCATMTKTELNDVRVRKQLASLVQQDME